MDFTLNLSGLPPRVAQRIIKTVQHEDAAAYAVGRAEQLRLKKWYDNAATTGMNTDIGRQTMVMSRGQWLMAMRRFGQLCFADPEFAPWLLKKDDVFRVKDVGTRLQSGYTGLGFSKAAGAT